LPSTNTKRAIALRQDALVQRGNAKALYIW
jgi:hypothetical protein